MAEYKIGYIDTYHSDRNVFIGGALVTDCYGIPLEFRHTDAVSPTKLEQILYGRSLDKYLKADTLANALLKDLEKKPDLLVVPDESYYTLTRNYPFPFVQLGTVRREPLAKPGDFQEVSENEIHLQILSNREPVRIKVDRKNAPTLASVKAMILEIGRTMDIVEPFDRVRGALRAIADDAGRS
ncbi:MAG: hypothetical protein ABIH66_03725 [bacterium]